MIKPIEIAYLVVVVLISFVALVPFHFGEFSNTEELHTTVFSNTFFAKALLNGDYPVWTHTLGFGIPFPIDPNQIHHPLVLLFGLMDIGLALSVFYQFHLT